jgi:hypothetical protein
VGGGRGGRIAGRDRREISVARRDRRRGNSRKGWRRGETGE